MKALFKIDLAEPYLPYPYTLYKMVNGKWVPLQNNHSIAALEEAMKEELVFPIYYDNKGNIIDE